MKNKDLYIGEIAEIKGSDKNMDNELVLFDRLNVIRDVINKHGEDKFYLSFSGGKDSTVLHYLINEALPNNKIPRVFCDTGIEYDAIKAFVYDLAKTDERITVIKPSRNVKQVLEKDGYPFKSKEHSHMLFTFNNSGLGKSVRIYLGIEGYKSRTCPNILRYQFGNNFNLKISDKCCLRLKKEPFRKWEKKHNKTTCITGMMQNEGGQRASVTNCIIKDKDGAIKKFHPLLKVNDDFENWYIETRHIQLCELYYPPYNFNRTGCKGCPYALKIQEQLDIMEMLLPNEKQQCEYIWKPIYAEYRRIGYRLRDNKQMRLF